MNKDKKNRTKKDKNTEKKDKPRTKQGKPRTQTNNKSKNEEKENIPFSVQCSLRPRSIVVMRSAWHLCASLATFVALSHAV